MGAKRETPVNTKQRAHPIPFLPFPASSPSPPPSPFLPALSQEHYTLRDKKKEVPVSLQIK
ncbi:hypothetical protein E2C01_022792 [Portunus trituberculatus]|uniref:Uncharacterized protein n=1 Tax=Portunus trituberculatus TaxID=210409 RepID=A0A5B7E6C0_PORTR|nr:hypothetical protein [Portunus trituberculatus]